MGWFQNIFGGSEQRRQPADPRKTRNDPLVRAPEALAPAIRAAGGDPCRVVDWVKVDSGTCWRFKVQRSKALDAWRALQAQVASTNHWPVLLGDDFSISLANEQLTSEGQTAAAEILNKAKAVDVDAWARAQLAANIDLDPDYEMPHDEWPAELAARKSFEIPGRVESEGQSETWIGLFATANAWEVPAFLKFGDWNAVPSPEIHVALANRWLREFGAELVGVSHDMIEFQVVRPPTTRDQAIALAELQYQYCPDIIDQGVGSIEAHAATLLSAPVWHFWWD